MPIGWLCRGMWIVVGIFSAVTTAEVSHVHFALLKFSAVGLSDPIALRTLLLKTPVPFLPGEWITLLLIIGGLGLALFTHLYFALRFRLMVLSLVLTAPIIAVIYVACSRAAFLSVFALVICSALCIRAYSIANVKQSSSYAISILLYLGIVLAVSNYLVPGIVPAYLKTEESQQRSTAGRISIWKRSAYLIEAYPILGVGSGRSPLYLSAEDNDVGTIGFASRTFSLPLQILAEQGIVGSLSWICMLAAFFWEAHERLKNTYVPIEIRTVQATLACTVTAVLLRELTYSSLLEHSLSTICFFSLLALASQHVPESRG